MTAPRKTLQADLTRTRAHAVAIAEGSSDLATLAVPFLKAGLSRNETCFYLTNGPPPNSIVEAVAAAGEQADALTAREALVFLDARQFARSTPFDTVHMAETVRLRVSEARLLGAASARIAADMTWTLTVSDPNKAHVEWESLAEEMTETGVAVLCMYPRDRFEPGLLRRLLRGHERAIAGDVVVVGLAPIFQELTRTELREIVKAARERRVAKGRYYFHQGDEAAEIYLLTNGLVRLEQADSGGLTALLRLVGAAEGFGEETLFGDAMRPLSAQALTATRSLSWTASWMREFIGARLPSLFWSVARAQRDRLMQARGRVRDFATVAPEPRLARLFRRLTDTFGLVTTRGVTLEIALTGRDLATMIGASHYTVSRILAQWTRLGILDAPRGRIRILDWSSLGQIAGSDDAN